eukprot:162565_1
MTEDFDFKGEAYVISMLLGLIVTIFLYLIKWFIFKLRERREFDLDGVTVQALITEKYTKFCTHSKVYYVAKFIATIHSGAYTNALHEYIPESDLYYLCETRIKSGSRCFNECRKKNMFNPFGYRVDSCIPIVYIPSKRNYVMFKQELNADIDSIILLLVGIIIIGCIIGFSYLGEAVFSHSYGIIIVLANAIGYTAIASGISWYWKKKYGNDGHEERVITDEEQQQFIYEMSEKGILKEESLSVGDITNSPNLELSKNAETKNYGTYVKL